MDHLDAGSIGPCRGDVLERGERQRMGPIVQTDAVLLGLTDCSLRPALGQYRIGIAVGSQGDLGIALEFSRQRQPQGFAGTERHAGRPRIRIGHQHEDQIGGLAGDVTVERNRRVDDGQGPHRGRRSGGTGGQEGGRRRHQGNDLDHGAEVLFIL